MLVEFAEIFNGANTSVFLGTDKAWEAPFDVKDDFKESEFDLALELLVVLGSVGLCNMIWVLAMIGFSSIDEIKMKLVGG